MKERFDRFTNAIAAIYQDIRKIKQAEMSRYDLQSGHADCLHLLLDHPEGLTSGKLAEVSGMDKAAVSRYMKVLEERGYAVMEERDEKIYRRKWKLTKEGKQTARHIQRRIDAAVSAVGDFMNEKQRAQLYDVLEQIVANIDDYVGQVNDR